MGKNYPYELTLDEFEDFIGDTGAEFIHFDDEERGDGYEMVIIEDNQKRRIAAIEFVKENPEWQLYSQVDLYDDVGYAAGPRVANLINPGLYVAIKAKGYGPPDNS